MRRGSKAIDWEQAGSCNALERSALVAAHAYSMVITGSPLLLYGNTWRASLERERE